MEQIPMTTTSLQQRSQPVLLPRASSDHRTEHSLHGPLTRDSNSPYRCRGQEKNKISPRAASRKSRFRGSVSHLRIVPPWTLFRGQEKCSKRLLHCSCEATKSPATLLLHATPQKLSSPLQNPRQGSLLLLWRGRGYRGEVPATARRCLQVKSVLRAISDSTAH